jgi:hypothetical protein
VAHLPHVVEGGKKMQGSEGARYKLPKGHAAVNELGSHGVMPVGRGAVQHVGVRDALCMARARAASACVCVCVCVCMCEVEG